MKKTFIRICITYYSKKHIAPDVHYYRNDGTPHGTSTWNELTVAEANKLMWALVKIGGKNEYRSNRYKSSICERQVTFYGEL